MPVAEAQKRNGFDLSDASVPVNEIRKTGVRRDGIPSIDKPRFLAAEDADFLEDDDRVIGVYRNGLAKAYPIRILDHHEVVNDEFASEAILVTYCPLCYTGMVFSAQASDFGLEFGVSGLLYNSDVLLYDRRTGSLWSQIMSTAIAGPLKGMMLPAVPASHTTWRHWRARHPETAVLSTGTGYRRDYRRSPYLDYSRSGKLMFPVKERSAQFPNKSLVLGISMGKVNRAYPFEELRKNAADVFEDVIGGKPVTIEWSNEDDFARVLDANGEELRSVIAYWFAWYAFHPDTEIFRHISSDN
ncbi:MAG: DUF3179 domain-containing protein [Gammaproteobacteria bacterium]|nr:DUF3179 domain-containing protein [Gammaproteobacteria bacterium]